MLIKLVRFKIRSEHTAIGFAEAARLVGPLSDDFKRGVRVHSVGKLGFVEYRRYTEILHSEATGL